MPIPTTIFENNYRAAHEVSRYIDQLRPSPQRFTLRPYQFQAPAFTDWWLVPSSDWPAYHHSKLFVHRTWVDSEALLFTGFYVEQGLSAELKGQSGVKRSLVMQPDWYWFKFLHRAKSGALDPALRQVLERSECPVVVWLDAYAFNRVPHLEQGSQSTESDTHKADDVIEFVIRHPNLQFELSKQAGQVMSPLNKCTNLRELADQLEILQELQWFWVNLLIGVRLRYGTSSTGTWGAAKIWRNILEPWTPWVH